MLLVVDDNALWTQTIARVLASRGYLFEVVGTGAEALRRIIADGEKYSLMLVDIHLPDIDGASLARTVRALADPKKSALPIIAVTGDLPPPPIDVIEARFLTTLTKPVLNIELTQAVDKYSRFPARADPAEADNNHATGKDGPAASEE